MVALRGAVTTVEKMDVEVSSEELKTHSIKEFTPYELAYMAYTKWLKEKSLGVDVVLTGTRPGEYVFKEYENNGSHYSGYYERPEAYQKGDEVIWKNFHELLNSFK